MQDSMISSVSGITLRRTLSASPLGAAEQFSQEKVFPLMLKEIGEKAEELEALGKHYNAKNKSKTRKSRSLSSTEPEDYKEIMYRKGLFLDNLNQALEDVRDNSLEDGPKYAIHYYNKFSSLIETRCKESKQEIQQKTELLKEHKFDTNQLFAQGSVFANLIEDDNDNFTNQEHHQASLQFEEAKADLGKLINLSFPDEDERNEFSSVMALLVEAHINFLENVEDQYVEVSPSASTNAGLRCLMEDFTVVEHPDNPRKLRLSIDD